MMTTRIQHFLKVFISNDAGEPTHQPSNLLPDPTDSIPLMSASREAFSNGIKLALLGIDCNREGAEFLLNPFHEDLLQMQSASNNDLMLLKRVLQMCTFQADGDNTIIKYLTVAAYVARVSGFIGNFRYIISADAYNASPDTGSMGAGTVNNSGPAIQLNTVYLDPQAESFYYGRVGTQTVDVLADVKNIPNDDYLRYPRMELAQRFLPTEWSRTAAAALPIPKLTATNLVSNINGAKVSEIAQTGMDIVMAELQRNALTYLDGLKIIRDHVITLLNESFLHYNDIQNNNNNDLPFYNATQLHISNVIDRLDYTIFPHSNIHAHSFLVCPAISNACLVRVFSFMSNHAIEYFKSFPMLSTDNVYSTLINHDANTINPFYSGRISQMVTRLSNFAVSEETLGFKMILDLLSPYNLVRSIPSQGDVSVVDPISFAVEYLGLLVSKYMYYNTWMRNQYAYYGLVRDFFLRWFNFGEQHANTFDRLHGFGSRPGTPIMLYISGKSRLEDEISIYSYSSAGPPFPINNVGLLMSDIRARLCLTNNNICLPYNVNFGPYGVKQRVFRLPGNCYAPVIGTSTPELPIVAQLRTYFNFAERYRNLVPYSANKGATTAISMALSKLHVPISRFAQFFHCAYCPIYLSMAKSPFLLHDDVEANPINYKSWFALTETDPNGALNATIEAVFHHNAVQPFGHPQLPESINLLFSANVPGTFVTQGYSYTATVDFSHYGKLYSSHYPIHAFNFYREELMRRQQLMEAICITTSMAEGTFYRAMPDVVNAINLHYDTISMPLVSWIYLGQVMQNTLTSEDSVLSTYNTDYSKKLLPEMRLRRPSMCTMLPDGTKNITPYLECIRPVVTSNSSILFDYLFGLKSLRRLSRGVTLCYQTLPAPILFRTTHQDCPILISVSNDVVVQRTLGDNVSAVLHVTCSVPPHTSTFAVAPDDPHSLITMLKASVFVTHATYPPYFKLILTGRPNSYTEVATNFIYQLYRAGYLLIQFNHLYNYPYYTLKTPRDAHETAPLGEAEFKAIYSSPSIALFGVEHTTTSYTTRSALTSVCARNVLCTAPSEPTVTVASGLSGQEVAGSLMPQSVNRDLFPNVAVPDLYRQRVVTPAGARLMSITNPYSLSTQSHVLLTSPLSVDNIYITVSTD